MATEGHAESLKEQFEEFFSDMTPDLLNRPLEPAIEQERIILAITNKSRSLTVSRDLFEFVGHQEGGFRACLIEVLTPIPVLSIAFDDGASKAIREVLALLSPATSRFRAVVAAGLVEWGLVGG